LLFVATRVNVTIVCIYLILRNHAQDSLKLK